MRIFQPTVTGSNTTTGSLHISGPVYFYTLETSSVFHILTYNTSSGQVFFTGSNALLPPPFPFTGSAGITGSVVLTGSMFVSGAISASFGPDTVGFFGTASWAQSASQAIVAITSSYPINVTGSTLYSVNPLAGSNNTTGSIFFGTSAGLNATNASQSNFLGNAGVNATNAYNSNFLGNTAGSGATNANNSNFLGQQAGSSATNASQSNLLGFSAGASATNAHASNFLGFNAGQFATNANNSNFLGRNAGASAANVSQSNFIGSLAGNNATNAIGSNFIGYQAGRLARSASYSVLIGYNAGINTSDTVYILSNNTIIGTNITLPASSKDSINLGGIIFATGSYSTTTGSPFSGSAGGKVGINIYPPQYNLHVSGTVAFPSLTTSSQANVVTIDSISGQLFYTASNALSVVSTPLNINDDSVLVKSNPTFINFTGSGVSASVNGDGVDVYIPGGGSGTPAPFDTYIQYNENDAFGAEEFFRYNYTNHSLNLGSDVTASGNYSFAQGYLNLASNLSAHAQGQQNTASGNYSHAEGFGTKATNQSSHAEGETTLASGVGSHAEGALTTASGNQSHVEGIGSKAIGTSAHAEGYYNVAFGNYSHAEGYGSIASGSYSHAEGYSIAYGEYSHAEGADTKAYGFASNVKGYRTIASGAYQLVIGQYNVFNESQSAFIIGDGNNSFNPHNLLFASQSWFEVSASNVFLQGLPNTSQTDVLTYNSTTGQVFYTASSAIGGGSGTPTPPAPSDTYIQYNQSNAFGAEADFRYIYDSHSLQQGNGVTASGLWSHAQGSGSIASGEYSHAEGGAKFIFWEFTEAIGTGSHAEGAGSIAFGNGSHAEGRNTYTLGDYSHAEGVGTYTSRSYSHAEGFFTSASGDASHAEGFFTKALNDYSHTEGLYTVTSGNYSHAEGSGSVTLGIASHAEGRDTIAEGDYSHAEGRDTVAEGDYSHAGGLNTTSSGLYQTVVGQNNISLTSQSAFIVGGGLTSVNKSNAFVVIPQTVLNDSVLQILVDSASISASYLSINNLPTSPQTHLLVYNTASGQVYYTASSAVGGSTFNSTSSFLGNGLSSSFNINHGFNTLNLHITVYSASGTYETVYPDIRRINANTASIVFANPPLTDQYIVYISQ